jgi:hypothetical protein
MNRVGYCKNTFNLPNITDTYLSRSALYLIKHICSKNLLKNIAGILVEALYQQSTETGECKKTTFYG